MAAVLACGPDAVLSHRAAAALCDLRPIPSGPIDVTVPARGRRGQKGIRVHNVRRLDAEDRATVEGIPVTSIPRTLLDYAEVARPQQLRHAIEAAERTNRLDGNALQRLIARSTGRRGLKPLRAAIDASKGSAPWTQSELERAFLALVRDAEIAEPAANVLVAGVLVDLVWLPQRLVAEVDSYGFHRTRARFEEDRRRGAGLLVAGYRVLRVTQRRIEQEPRRVISELRALLAAA